MVMSACIAPVVVPAASALRRLFQRPDETGEQALIKTGSDTCGGTCSCGEQFHQFLRQRRADERPAAEAHDRHARRHAGAVGEPLHQCRDRRDVAEAQADAADEAIAKPDQPEHFQLHPERGEQQAAAEAAA
jgi:hypothetical protein